MPSAFAAAVSLPASAEMANAALKDKSGKAVGDVDLSQTPNGVLLKLSIKGLPPASTPSTSTRSANAKRRSSWPGRISIPAITSTA